MVNKLRILVIILICLNLIAIPAMADDLLSEPVKTEMPPVLSSDYIANITWSYPQYVHNLSGGNKLLSRVGAWDPGIIEVDREGKEVWYYRGIQPNSARRLDNGNTLVADSGAPGPPFMPRVVELTTKGEKAWEYVLPSINQAPRYAERLSNGNTLIVLPFEVREVNPQKKIVWQFGTGKPGKPGTAGNLERPLRAYRLGNGSTLIVDRGYAHGKVLEVTPAKKVVWQFSSHGTSSATAKPEEPQPPSLLQPLDAVRLSDGTTLVTDKKQDLLFYVDASGKVVEARTWVGLYKAAPVTDLWYALPLENGNVIISATMVTGRSRVAEVVGSSMKVVWPKPNL